MSEDKEEKPKLPSFVTMAKNFAVDLAKYVADGAPNVSESNYKKRLQTCKSCPHLIKSSMRCGKCGCLLEHKAKWKTTTCPINKWIPEVLSKEQTAKLEVIRTNQQKQEALRAKAKAKHAHEKEDNSEASDKV
tara:strand:- start:7036 stop:7434 length:399 start_codon:yes stop_codon:yes gene_type:complete